MCVIIDADVVNSATTSTATEAGRKFLEMISNGRLRLVIGGSRLNEEYSRCNAEFKKWLSRAIRTGHAFRIADETIDVEEAQMKNLTRKSCDTHVLALARISGTRLVFTNDRRLQADCKSLLEPSARIYTTNDERTKFDSRKRELLDSTSCELMN